MDNKTEVFADAFVTCNDSMECYTCTCTCACKSNCKVTQGFYETSRHCELFMDSDKYMYMNKEESV